MSGYKSAAGIAAIQKAETAGYVIGPEWSYGMMALRRLGEAEPHIWLDVGNTVSFGGDASDPDDELLFEIIELFNGPEAVARARRAWDMPEMAD